ncbi:hypothetical protein ACIHCX_07190 [Streptomyces sp. NPDC052043]|uniref:hypothetical protein n=1 Tax=Streptomyces sp. NPDC052043 TaxID=3365684 RepID=UPI0037D06EBB
MQQPTSRQDRAGSLAPPALVARHESVAEPALDRLVRLTFSVARAFRDDGLQADPAPRELLTRVRAQVPASPSRPSHP